MFIYKLQFILYLIIGQYSFNDIVVLVLKNLKLIIILTSIMENNSLENLTEEQITFLQTYNFVKNNSSLVALAEQLESTKIAVKDNHNLSLMNNIATEILNQYLTSNSLSAERKFFAKKIRIYMDGVFDIIHSGHFNALRQSKKLGDILVIGVNSDEDVEKAKGPTLMNVHERAALVAACKWVDEVVIDTPYTPTISLLDELNVDFCAHGDDPCFNELGEDAYAEMKKQGRFRVFKRTEGISTTEIIGRLLMLPKDNKKIGQNVQDTEEPMTSTSLLRKASEDNFVKGPVVSSFLTTSWRLHEFCNERIPKDNDVIMYIDGAWDILHVGHIETLKKAKEKCDFLYVGVHDDMSINKHRGKNYPILNMQERVFNLLALKYVDDVVIGAPWNITNDLIKSLKITKVLHGTQAKYDEGYSIVEENDPFIIPKSLANS